MNSPHPPLSPDTSLAGARPQSSRSTGLTLAIFASMLVCAIVFSIWPEIDLAVSSAFYDPSHGFVGDRNLLVTAVYRGIPLMSKAIIIALFVALFAYCFQRGVHGQRRRIQVAFLIVAMALGPGLLVDVALKDYWGRARPAKVEAFGGASTFSPALVPSDQCEGNCSFVSGHASAGFYLVSLGFLGGAVARRRWTLIGLVVGTLFGIGRITQGGHFLTDIVFSFYATWLGAWLAWLIFVKFGWLAVAPDTPESVRQD